MLSIEDQLTHIQSNFGEYAKIDKKIIEIQLFPKLFLILDLKNYPKMPKITIPSQVLKIIGDLETFIPELARWDKNNPPLLANIIKYMKYTIDALSGLKVRISEDLLNNIFLIASNSYPNEMFCVLRLINGIFEEFILAPGSQSSETSAIFFPGRIGIDKSLAASCHSHPNGSNHWSAADLNTFKQKPVNIILGYPYTYHSIGVYNQLGEKIEFEICD